MATYPQSPSWEDQAQYGQMRFYGLHEMDEVFMNQVRELSKTFTPAVLNEARVLYYAHKYLETLCALGAFVAYPEAFVISAAYMCAIYKTAELTWPDHQNEKNDIFWTTTNKILNDLATKLAKEIEAEDCEAAVRFNLYRFGMMLARKRS